MELLFTLCLPHDEASVPVVRHLLSSALDRLGVDPDCASDVELAVCEACTNVLKHANAAPEEFEVRIEISEEECQIEVSDLGAAEVGDALTRVGTVDEEGGRGIQLMRALVDQLHFVARPERGLSVHLLKKLALEEDAALSRLAAAAGP